MFVTSHDKCDSNLQANCHIARYLSVLHMYGVGVDLGGGQVFVSSKPRSRGWRVSQKFIITIVTLHDKWCIILQDNCCLHDKWFNRQMYGVP